ncbi:MAG TPA: hypothetical protein VIM57_09990 [Luteolibacter sp.]
MKIKDKIDYENEIGLACAVILFEDGSAAITGAENYIIEESANSLEKAEEILKKKGYKKRPK